MGYPVRTARDIEEAKERLRQAIRVMRELPKETKINYRLWQNKCGTEACLAGHCANDDWFMWRGLKLIDDPKTFYKWQPYYDGWESMKAVQEFFRLDIGEADTLFNPDGKYGSPEGAIRRLKRLLRKLDNMVGIPE